MGFFENFRWRRQERRAADRPDVLLAKEEEKKSRKKALQSCVASRLMSFRQLLRSCVGASRGDLSARRASSRRISRSARWEASAALEDYIINARGGELDMFEGLGCRQPVSRPVKTATMRVTVDVHAEFDVSDTTTDNADTSICTSIWSEDDMTMLPAQPDLDSVHEDSFSSLDALWPRCDMNRCSSSSSMDLSAGSSDSDSLNSISSLDDDDSLFDVTQLDDTDVEYDIVCNDNNSSDGVTSAGTYVVTRDDNVVIIELVPTSTVL